MTQFLADIWEKSGDVLGPILVALLVGAIFFIASSLLHRKIVPWLVKLVDEEKHPITALLIHGFVRPATLLLKVLGGCIALISASTRLAELNLPGWLLRLATWLPPVLQLVIRISIVVAVAWGFVASSDIFSLLLRNARHKLDIHMSKSVSRFLSAVFNVVVVAIAVVVIMSELNYDINGLVAGLGLGGLTIALAAKDSAANFFGGLVLITEKPFEIGDWISCDGVEGTVEDINLRSTKVRTSAGSLTIVPNANLSAAPITNWSGVMKKRRADFTLQMTYQSPKKQLKEFIAATRTMLETDPDILTDSITVRLSDLGESGLAIRVIFYTSLPGFSDFIAIKERVNYALIDLAEKFELNFAYPTQTVYLEGNASDAATVEVRTDSSTEI